MFISNFLLHFWNLHQYLLISKQRWPFIAYIFPKLQSGKNVLREMPKKHRLRTPLNSQHAKRIPNTFWLHFWKLHQFLNIWAKKMTLIAYIFPKLRKTCLDKCIKTFQNKMFQDTLRQSETLVKSPWDQF